ncbi:Hypothetical protein LUCI_1303 [Lucifera butyrica]|uniref:Uncharacterized protein n=1 Tax=Lucifera butyrica TaxID=1351585 RepID=A0A498RAA2_9FIRM|nr:hypothetical protein [Lucifera butyrica]VBB06088.1 Hypothetical protein LUCI_1303 [Lucifera butyrica]
MDLIFLLLLLAFFYLIPELLRRQKKGDYKYPEIPKPALPEEPEEKIDFEFPCVMTVPVKEEKKEAMPHMAIPVDGASGNPADQPLPLAMDGQTIMNGIIFAEILQQPRSKQILKSRFPRRR